MVSYVKNYIQDQAMGYLHTGITAAGTMAGNAVGGVGSLIENGGRSIGESTTGSINGFGGYINNYGDGIRNKFAADGYVGASASQKAKREPSEATKPYGLKALPDASSAGTMVTNASRKVLPSSAQPKPSAAATKQVRSAGSRPIGATKPAVGAAGAPKNLPASATKKPIPAGAPAPKTNAPKPSLAPTNKPRTNLNGAAKAPARSPNSPKPLPVQPGPANKRAAANGKIKISEASRPKAAKKPVIN